MLYKSYEQIWSVFNHYFVCADWTDIDEGHIWQMPFEFYTIPLEDLRFIFHSGSVNFK